MFENSYYFLSFIEGILTFISPCILPMLPVYFLYLAGDVTGGEACIQSKNRLFLNSTGFVAGFSAVFVLLGATATTLGSFLRGHLDLFRMTSGVVMVLFGLNFTGLLKIPFLNIERRFAVKIKNPNIPISILFGVIFAFGWTPCLGTFLSSALLMAGNSDTLPQGVLMLLLYSLGLGIPFIISAVIFDRACEIFMSLKKYGRIINMVSGIVLILAGILVFTDRMKYFGALFSLGIGTGTG